jgi:hypothetical protein
MLERHAAKLARMCVQWLAVRRSLAFVVVLVFVCACGATEPRGEEPKPPRSTGETVPRVITPRSQLPSAIQPLLPKHGIYVAGGGFVSTPWRIVVDLDQKTIYSGTADEPNAPSFGPMDKENKKELSPRNGSHLMKLAHAAWVESPPKTPPDPIADYDEILIVLEDEETFFLQGYGPIRRPVAANAIVEIRAAAGM